MTKAIQSPEQESLPHRGHALLATGRGKGGADAAPAAVGSFPRQASVSHQVAHATPYLRGGGGGGWP